MSIPRIGIVGIHGHGRSHVHTVLRGQREGRMVLAAVADTVPAGHGELPADVRQMTDVGAMLEPGDLDVVIVSTPIHTHAWIAEASIEAGADVLLEKPPTATMSEFDQLRALAARSGARVQVGFQSLGSTALPALRALVADGAVGEVQRYGASAGWVRDSAYWTRSAWAGRRELDGRVVADGVLTNPLAHATATALAVAPATDDSDVERVELDLHRANEIAADDTSVARLTLADDRRLTTAVTLCAARREEPYVEIVGDRGRLRFYYAIDVVQHQSDAEAPPFTSRFDRVSLLDDLLAARRDGGEILAPLAATGGFMRLLDGVMAAPDPRPISADHWYDTEDDRGAHRVVRGVEAALHEAVRSERTFRELGLPWA